MVNGQALTIVKRRAVAPGRRARKRKKREVIMTVVVI
jgi:hypothetical protein